MNPQPPPDRVPESLANDLRRIAGSPSSLPKFAACSVAERHFEARRARKWLWKAAGALAASIVFAALVWPRPQPESFPNAARTVHSDLNGDGQVDMLDVFTLAKANKYGEVKGDWGFGGSGHVDDIRITNLARTAVRLNPPDEGGKS
jgi:hypothetical protein